MRRFAPSLSRALIAGFLAVLVIGSMPAKADPGGVLIATRGQYLPGDDRNGVPVVALKDHEVIFTNLDAFSFGGHSFTSKTPGLFDSGIVNLRQQVTVGLAGLPSGTYGFYCTVHGQQMSGTLVIV